MSLFIYLLNLCIYRCIIFLLIFSKYLPTYLSTLCVYWSIYLPINLSFHCSIHVWSVNAPDWIQCTTGGAICHAGHMVHCRSLKEEPTLGLRESGHSCGVSKFCVGLPLIHLTSIQISAKLTDILFLWQVSNFHIYYGHAANSWSHSNLRSKCCLPFSGQWSEPKDWRWFGFKQVQ